MCRSENRFWEPPYKPANVYGALGTRTVAMSALGYQNNRQWDTHNLYGMAEGIMTANAVANITGKRPFVLSRCVGYSMLPSLAFISLEQGACCSVFGLYCSCKRLPLHCFCLYCTCKRFLLHCFDPLVHAQVYLCWIRCPHRALDR
jgi:hypothetical protein